MVIFRSTGFILEGFPRTSEEAQYLSSVGLFPDAVLLMTVRDEDVVGRLLPPKLDKWKVKRDKRLAKLQRRKEKAKKKRVCIILQDNSEIMQAVLGVILLKCHLHRILLLDIIYSL